MKTMIVSNDSILIERIQSINRFGENKFLIYSESTNPLDVMSSVCTMSPSILIVDDDFLQPQTAHLLRSIRKVNKNVAIIFITSSTSIELGREVSQLGIYYYAIKPIEEKDLYDSLESIIKLIQRNSVSKHQLN